MACAEPNWKDDIDEIWAAEERVNDDGVFCRFNPDEWTSGPDLVETVQSRTTLRDPSVCWTYERLRHRCGGRICIVRCVGHVKQYEEVDTRVFKL